MAVLLIETEIPNGHQHKLKFTDKNRRDFLSIIILNHIQHFLEFSLLIRPACTWGSKIAFAENLFLFYMQNFQPENQNFSYFY